MKAYLNPSNEKITWNGDSTLPRKTKHIQQMNNQDPPQDKMKDLYVAWMAYYNWKPEGKENH